MLDPDAQRQRGRRKGSMDGDAKVVIDIMTMQVMLAVEPASQLEKDIAYITRARAAIAADQKQHAQSAKQRHQAPQGPRKQLGK